jgi:high-affinity iron transporter
MLPTFVIGLREGLEAALIVGIIAAFLRQQGRRDLMRWLYAGVAAAIALCVAVGVTLDLVSRDLPQKQQEGLETVVGVLAVGMVTYMVVWMRRHARELKGQLEGLAAEAIAPGNNAARAMVVMAFFAVLREGFETVVFLLAAFNEAGNATTAGIGAVLGILVAVGLGYGIYRGGVRINLSRFFRVTGLVLVFVAAGLVVSALHTGHEAGWYTFGQGRAVDLTSVPLIGWLVRAGSVQASLLTGMLGVQPRPVWLEAFGWLAYLVPVGCYVAWPPGKPVPERAFARVFAGVGVACVALALALALSFPRAVDRQPVTRAGAVSAQLVSVSPTGAVVRTERQEPAEHPGAGADEPTNVRVKYESLDRHDDLITKLYTVEESGPVTDAPRTMPTGKVSDLNGGRLPIGVRVTGADLPVRFRTTDAFSVWVFPASGRVVDFQWKQTTRASVVVPNVGAVPLAQPIRVATTKPISTAVIVAAARGDQRTIRDRTARRAQVWTFAVLGGLALILAAGCAAADRRGRRPEPRAATPEPQPTRIQEPVYLG